jgi:hypothetical protein
MARAHLVDLPEVTTFGRQTFTDEVWDYKPGECVTVLAPYGGGKTQLSYELLGATAEPDLMAVVLVMKARDATIDRYTKQFGFRTVRDWPPPLTSKMVKKPPGYVLWPLESDDPDVDDTRHRVIFQRALRDCYRNATKGSSKGRIVFGDETYSLEEELNLTKDLVRLWTKGRSMSCGLWAASQRPVYISRWAFQAQHIFLGNDPDVDMQRRYGEIGGGIDPGLVRGIVASLKRYQFLYINREERAICIVDAS